MTTDFRHWNNVIELIRKGEMPPSDKPRPKLEERNEAVAAIKAILLVEARKNAGDPGRPAAAAFRDQRVKA